MKRLQGMMSQASNEVYRKPWCFFFVACLVERRGLIISVLEYPAMLPLSSDSFQSGGLVHSCS